MGKLDDKALQAFTDMMVKSIESISDNWKKPWISTQGRVGVPKNIDGRVYSGINSLMLFLLTAKENYKTPVFMTFNQARNNGAMINKGEKAFPVVFWNRFIKDKETGKQITPDQYDKLKDEEKAKYKVIPYMKHFLVWNIDQTNLQQVKPEKYNSISSEYKAQPLKDENGMYKNPEIDRLIAEKKWLCDIRLENQDQAYFSPREDYIKLPLKAQFESGEAFYATALHEMTHSTGVESRLNRKEFHNYGREELVAELTAAVTAQTLGISTTIREENAQYLKSWLKQIKEEPDFLYSILSDVNKASNMITTEVEKMKVQEEVKEDKVLVAINNLEENIKKNIDPNATIKVESINGETDDFKLSAYGRDGIYLGDIKGTKHDDSSWYLTTDTSIVIMVPDDHLKFMNKNLYGSILTEDSLALRNVATSKLSLTEESSKVKLSGVEITNPMNKGYRINVEINGERQLSEPLSNKDYSLLQQGKVTDLDLAKKYFQPAIDTANSIENNNKIKR